MQEEVKPPERAVEEADNDVSASTPGRGGVPPDESSPGDEDIKPVSTGDGELDRLLGARDKVESEAMVFPSEMSDDDVERIIDEYRQSLALRFPEWPDDSVEKALGALREHSDRLLFFLHLDVMDERARQILGQDYPRWFER